MVAVLGLVSLVATPLCADQAPRLPDDFPLQGLTLTGQSSVEGSELKILSKPTRLAVMPVEPSSSRVELEVNFSPTRGIVDLYVAPSDTRQPLNAPAAWRIEITHEESHGGSEICFAPHVHEEGQRWQLVKPDMRWAKFWPTQERLRNQLREDGFAPRTWRDRWWKLGVETSDRTIRLCFDGQVIMSKTIEQAIQGPIVFEFSTGDRIRHLKVGTPRRDPFVPVDLGRVVNATNSVDLGPSVTVEGVPFDFANHGKEHLDLRKAEWPEWRRDPSSYYENYDGGRMFYDDPRMFMARVPVADYVAAHLLATADEDPRTFPGLTLRAGAYGFLYQVIQHNFSIDVSRHVGKRVSVGTPQVGLRKIRVPMPQAFAQDLRDAIDIELTKQVRLAVRRPDPSRYRYRPLGLPSGVKVFAMTLEKCPLQMRVTSRETGNAFVEPAKPVFHVSLHNITDRPQAFTLQATATHLDGSKTKSRRKGKVDASKSIVVDLAIPHDKRGYHDLRIELRNGDVELWLARDTSFAVLPPDSRRHRETCPLGTWDFSGGHFTSQDADLVGSLYRKAGLRYGMFNFSAAQRAKWDVVQGLEPRVHETADGYTGFVTNNPTHLRTALLMHENAISEAHCMRVPDRFLDRPPYQLPEPEKKRFDTLFDAIQRAARAMREKYPDVHLRLGNGPLPTKEEFYRHKFPAELFDSAGNESAVFARPPEAQPPDWISMNAGLWMDRQMLDHYGYRDKPVTQCYEICYPGTNPGNLSLRAQADYFVRHAMHALAWRVPVIRMGAIMDMGNSYHSSNWGSSGLCNRMPEVNVKPAFVAMATLTLVLDGAKFSHVLEMGSPSLYGVVFDRADGKRVHALWTVQGKWPVKLTVSGDAWTRIDDQGNESVPRRRGDQLTEILSPSPVFLVGNGKVTGVEAGVPGHEDAGPVGRVSELSSLDRLEDWEVEPTRHKELETHNTITPRRKGDFAFENADSFESRRGVIRVTPRPIKHGTEIMPMYAVLAHRKGIELPGRPTEIGLWVNGNSSGGRIIFELTDASGQRWISIGASSTGEVSPWMLDWMPQEFARGKTTYADWNTDDVKGLSRIDFDGWRYVSFPLPGNYPGEGYHWPISSQWRHEGDGIVRYPLTLRKLIVELPEKTLHLTTYAPVPRKEIYLDRLIVAEGESEWLAPDAANLVEAKR